MLNATSTPAEGEPNTLGWPDLGLLRTPIRDSRTTARERAVLVTLAALAAPGSPYVDTTPHAIASTVGMPVTDVEDVLDGLAVLGRIEVEPGGTSPAPLIEAGAYVRHTDRIWLVIR